MTTLRASPGPSPFLGLVEDGLCRARQPREMACQGGHLGVIAEVAARRRDLLQ
jgi:hypothetical protein